MKIEDLLHDLPNLVPGEFEITSCPTAAYNCLGWALGDSQHWWWPTFDGVWLDNTTPDDTVEAFIRLFEGRGYRRSRNDDFIEGLEKVAIYAIDGVPAHVARQLPTGAWTSKLGAEEDISHKSLGALEGDCYGAVVVVMERPRLNGAKAFQSLRRVAERLLGRRHHK